MRAIKAKSQLRDSDLELDYEDAEAVSAAPRNGRRKDAELGAALPVQSSSSTFLEGLKEELFQLEVEHTQGQITQQEYEKAKAALDQTLQRALKRQAGRV